MTTPKYPYPGDLQAAAEYLYNQSYHLRRLRTNFRRFDKVVQSKTHGVDGEFAQWIQHMFTHTLCLAVRRLLDGRRDVISLRKLMQRIRSKAGDFTRERWCSAWMDGVPEPAHLDDQPEEHREYLRQHSKERWERHANEYFDKFAPGSARALDPDLVLRDEQTLDADCEKIEDMVNAYIAHDAKEKPVGLPTYGELDAAVDLVVNLVEKYYSLFHQTIPSDTEDLDAWKNRPSFPFPDQD